MITILTICIIILLNRPLIVKPFDVTHYKYIIKFKPEILKGCNSQIVYDPESYWGVHDTN